MTDHATEQVALFMNARDHRDYGTAIWSELDIVGREAYLADAAALVAAVKALGWAPALTPTDDEREALDWALRYARRYWQHGGEPESQRALSVLASALRRSEVPEPTGDEREALGIMILRVADEEKPVWEAGLDAIVDAVAGFRSGEVLVEGSWFKRDDLPTVLGNFMRSSNEYARQAKELHVALTELRSLEPQGEPSNRVIVMCARCGLFPVVGGDEINSDIVVCDRCAFAEGRESAQGEPSDAGVDDAWWKAQEAGQLPRTPGPSIRQAFEVGYRAALRAAGGVR